MLRKPTSFSKKPYISLEPLGKENVKKQVYHSWFAQSFKAATTNLSLPKCMRAD
jgi:hypothetical protein